MSVCTETITKCFFYSAKDKTPDFFHRKGLLPTKIAHSDPNAYKLRDKKV